MIKDILVNLPVGRLSDSAVNYAVSVAVVFDAHLTGVAFVDEPFVPGTVFNTADFIAAYRAQVEKAAKVAVTKFEDATRRAGVSATSQMLGSTLAGLDDLFTQITRRFDLSVVGQSESGKETLEVMFPETALFGSGRPVLVVPYIQKEGPRRITAKVAVAVAARRASLRCQRPALTKTLRLKPSAKEALRGVFGRNQGQGNPLYLPRLVDQSTPFS